MSNWMGEGMAFGDLPFLRTAGLVPGIDIIQGIIYTDTIDVRDIVSTIIYP